MWGLVIGIIFILPLLLLYFLGTNDEVCGVSLERESDPGPSPSPLPGPPEQQVLQCAGDASVYTEAPGHAVLLSSLLLKSKGCWLGGTSNWHSFLIGLHLKFFTGECSQDSAKISAFSFNFQAGTSALEDCMNPREPYIP